MTLLSLHKIFILRQQVSGSMDSMVYTESNKIIIVHIHLYIIIKYDFKEWYKTIINYAYCFRWNNKKKKHINTKSPLHWSHTIIILHNITIVKSNIEKCHEEKKTKLLILVHGAYYNIICIMQYSLARIPSRPFWINQRVCKIN